MRIVGDGPVAHRPGTARADSRTGQLLENTKENCFPDDIVSVNADAENALPGTDEKTIYRQGIEQPLMIAFLLLALIPLTGIMYAQYAVSRVKEPLNQAAATSFEFGLHDREYRNDAREISALFMQRERFEDAESFARVEREVGEIGARMDASIEQLAHLADRKSGAQAMRMQRDLAEQMQQSLDTSRSKLDEMARRDRLVIVIDALLANLDRHFSSAAGESPTTYFSDELAGLIELLRQVESIRGLDELRVLQGKFNASLPGLRQGARTAADSSANRDADRVVTHISELASGPDGLFNTVAKVVSLRDRENTETAQTRVQRWQVINVLARSDEANQQATTNLLETASDTLSSSMIVLLLFFVASVLASLTVLHFYVRKQIVYRLAHLSGAIRRMNSGDLEQPVELGGEDELTEIAAAIEKARLNSIRVKENERLLEIRNQELEAANAELDKFAYVASHDLKSPLRAIQSLADFLEEDLNENLDEQSRRHFGLLRGRVKRMSRLLDSLLEYSRVGRQELEPETFDLKKVIEESASVVTPAKESVEIKGNFEIIKTWKTPLEQVVRNLVDNAFKHSGGDECKVVVEYSISDDALRIVVQDNGPGVPLAYQERIFEMFQTLRSRDEVEGSGMGLALLKKIADSFGGSIEVDSNPDKQPGARFITTWPLATATQDELEEFHRHFPPAGAPQVESTPPRKAGNRITTTASA